MAELPEIEELEEQFILRLPEEEARYIHSLLDKDSDLNSDIEEECLKISLDTETREGTVYIKDKVIAGKLVDLPTIIESSKTINNVNCYKTADITQMLICDYGKNDVRDFKIKHSHGLTPPMKNVAKTRFRKQLQNIDEVVGILGISGEVQKELQFLLKADSEAVSTRYEIYIDHENIKQQGGMITENSLFGNVSTDSDDTSSYDIMEF